MVLPPSKRQKAPKTARTRFPCRLSNPSECNKLNPPSHLSVWSVLLHFVHAPFAREAKRLIYFYSVRFSHFIDSLKLSFKLKESFLTIWNLIIDELDFNI